MCDLTNVALLSFFVLMAGSVISIAFGSIFIDGSCNNNLQDCTRKMNEIELVRVGNFSCGENCVKPEYVFTYDTGDTYEQVDGYVVNEVNIMDECAIITDSQTFEFNQTYTAYVDPEAEVYGVRIIECDTNPAKYNKYFDAGIGLIFVGAVLFAGGIFCLIYALNHP